MPSQCVQRFKFIRKRRVRSTCIRNKKKKSIKDTFHRTSAVPNWFNYNYIRILCSTPMDGCTQQGRNVENSRKTKLRNVPFIRPLLLRFDLNFQILTIRDHSSGDNKRRARKDFWNKSTVVNVPNLAAVEGNCLNLRNFLVARPVCCTASIHRRFVPVRLLYQK